MPYAVGLTGGIGSGKTTVCEMFSDLGVPVLDADRFARDVVERGSPALGQIANELGDVVLAPDGSLDRDITRRLVFQDPARRRALEAILHPRIKEAMRATMASLGDPYCLLCVPLLFESGWTDLVQRVAVVDVPEDLQRHRTMRRGGLTSAEVEAIMRAQLPRAERLARADDVLDNSGARDHLSRQVRALHCRYLDLAHGSAMPAEH